MLLNVVQGIPDELSKDNYEFTIKTCLHEIDRCYQDNIMPYFINMTRSDLSIQ